jgi:membrane protein DedA with SNARE-associated domain
VTRTSTRLERNDPLKVAVRVLILVRWGAEIAAFPLAPFLYKKHFVILVLMRPTKDVLLAAGFLLRLHKVGLIPVVSAAVPIGLVGVWLPYFLGRVHGKELRSGRVPRLAKRILDPKRTKKMQKLLHKKGKALIFLGRLALFPSGLVGTAAGAGELTPREFFPADVAGALTSMAASLGAGFGLGAAYKAAGPWIVAGAAVALVGASVIAARFLRRE